MKSLLITLAVLAIVGVGAVLVLSTSDTSIDTQSTNDNTASSSPERMELSGSGSFVADSQNSEVRWIGRKQLIRGYEDHGTVQVASGTASLAEGEIVNGEVELDMTTLEATSTSNTDLGVGRLTDHLHSDDFFGVETYPTAQFTFETSTSTNDVEDTEDMEENHEISGQLTITDQTNDISFPAEVYMTSDGGVVIDAIFTIDRTRWGITFGSGSFFENLGDNVIEDEVTIDAHLVFSEADNATSTQEGN